MASTSETPYEHTPLALVGMACRLPGARNLDEFWKLLIEGRSALGELPPDRLDRELVYDPEKGVRAKTYSSIGGVIDSFEFNRQVCPLPDALLANRDAAHLTLCEVAAQACRSGGLDPFNLPQRRVGVYIGHTRGTGTAGDITYSALVEQTAQYLRQLKSFHEVAGDRAEELIRDVVAEVRDNGARRDDQGGPDLTACMAAGLISIAFGLDGPYAALNAACASSLQALAMGARAVELGHLDMAIVGGASYCKSDSLVLFSQARSVSATGSRPFDDEADGLVTAEGYVVFLIKTLERALADGNEIFAVVRGVGVSSDGRGKSLWAPRKEGQIEAIRRAYGPGIEMQGVQYIEAHATSTQVGDATEITALATAMKEQLPPGAKIPIGSVKANVGHTLETAGMAGLLKTVLAMRHGVIPPQINVRKLNQNIDWEQIPFFVSTEARPWPVPSNGQPRRAAVNAFGIGGLNVHLVVDEFQPELARQLVARCRPHRWAKEPIAIVGMGAVLPGARRIEQVWDLFRSGRQAIVEAPDDRLDREAAYEPGSRRNWKSPTLLGGFITDFEYDWKTQKIPPKQIASADPLQFMLLDAVEQAFQQSGYNAKQFDRKRTAVFVGTAFGGDFGNQLQMGMRLPDFERSLGKVLRRHGLATDRLPEIGRQFGDVLLKMMPALNDETGSFTSSTLASRITKTFDLMGGAVAIDGGSSSAMMALSASVDVLRTGQCDLLVCAAGQRSMGLPTYEALSLSGVLNTAGAKSPLDADCQGYLPGEGAVVLLLKRLCDAHRDGDQVLGVIHGPEFARADSLAESLALSAQRALQQAGVQPADVTGLELGGVGVPALMREELNAMARVYGTPQREAPLVVGSPWSQIGFAPGCSALVSILRATLELEQQQMAPNVGLQKPAEWLTSQADQFVAESDGAPLPVVHRQGRMFAAVTSTTPGKLACHVVVERGQPVKTVDVPSRPAEAVKLASGTYGRAWHIARFSAASPEAMQVRLRQALKQPGDMFALSTAEPFDVHLPCRMAVVARTADEFSQRLQSFLAQPAGPMPVLSEDHGVALATSTGPVRAALVFAGQSSQYAGMLEPLVASMPAASAAHDQIDAALAELGYPSFADLAWKNAEALGRDVWLTQLSLLAADTILYETLAALGIRPWCVAGHSYGEFAALVSARSWNFATAARATHARCQAIEGAADALGRMISVAAAPEQVQPLIDRIGGRVYISHHNAPQQTVVGGEAAAVKQLSNLLKESRLALTPLAVPRPFHTPMLAGAQGNFRAALESIALDPPRIPVLSSVTNRFVADPLEIRDNLVRQLVEPVRFVDLVRRLLSCGVNALIEIGPQQVLTRLHRRILGDTPCLTIGTDHPQREPGEQLALVQAAWEVWQAPRATPEEASPAPRPLHNRLADAGRGGSGDSGGVASATTRGGGMKAVAVAQRGSSSSTVQRRLLSAPRSLLAPRQAPQVVEVSGNPLARGRILGEALAEPIRRMLRRYAALAPSGLAHERELARSLQLADSLLDAAARDELQGMAEAAMVDYEALLAHNLRLYPDLAGGCCHFATTAAANQGSMIHGANEDLVLRLVARDALTSYVQVFRPAQGFCYTATPLAGQVGTLSGINECGLSISSSMLLDVPRREDTQRGLLHGLVVRNVLAGAANIDQAVSIVGQHPGTGGWSLVVADAQRDEVALIEYDGRRVEVRRGVPGVTASNHAQLVPSRADVPAHSRARLQRLEQLFREANSSPIDCQQAQAILCDRFDMERGRPTRQPTMNTLCRVDNQASLVFEPQTRQFWVRSSQQSMDQGELFAAVDAGTLMAAGRPSVTMQPQAADALRAMAPKDALPSIDGSQRTCWKLVPYLTRLEPVAKRDFTWHGAALILGDNSLARALAEQLRQRGTPVDILSLDGTAEELFAEFDALWQRRKLPHLFLTMPFGTVAADPLAEDWTTQRRRHISLPYLLCQRWFQRLVETEAVDQGSIVACLRLGGTFGWDGVLPCPASGAWSGLTKGLDLEAGGHGRNPFRARVIDLAEGLPPEHMATAVIDALESADKELEVAHRADGRYAVRLGWFPEPVSLDLPEQSVPRGAWVVTGGARGVTAWVAQTLGKRFGMDLHLLGSSPRPQIDPALRHEWQTDPKALRARIMREAVARKELPADAWSRIEKAFEIEDNLRAMADAGLNVTYHVCDVRDRQQVRESLDAIRHQSGPIRGIVHGAGYESSTRFEKKRPERVEMTLAVKLDGAAHLMALTAADPVEYFIGFSSISGRLGGLGQTDYGVANETLAKLLAQHRQQKPQCRAVVIDWPAWDDVGMAVRSESKQLLQMRGVGFMPAVEGCEHLLDILAAGVPYREVVITDQQRWKWHFPGADPAGIVMAPAPAAETALVMPAQPSAVDGTDLVAQRYVLKLVDAPRLAAGTSLAIESKSVAIYGSNPLADALSARLTALGAIVHRLLTNSDSATARRQFDAFWQRQPIHHLVMCSPRDAEAVSIDEASRWQERKAAGIAVPYLLCLEWFDRISQLKSEEPNSLWVVTSLGGAFGVAGDVAAPEGGALAGVAKALRAENRRKPEVPLTVKVVDAPADANVGLLADALLAEWSGASPEVEVAFDGHRRGVLRGVREPAPAIEPPAVRSGGQWIVSGGARGITAEASLELARRYGLHLHLLGRTTPAAEDAAWRGLDAAGLKRYKQQVVSEALAQGRKPADVWPPIQQQIELEGNLRRFAEAGVSVTYHVCDVANYEQVAAVLADVRRRFGPIQGVIHGAGNLPKPIRSDTSCSAVLDSIAAKVDGAWNLLTLTCGDPLERFITFGSISGRFGAAGPSRGLYTMANELLAKVTDWSTSRRSGMHGTTIHWHAWGDVGMMTQPQNFNATSKTDFSLMPASEGVQHFLQELAAGLPARETVVSNPVYSDSLFDYPCLIDIAGGTDAADRGGPSAMASQSADPIADLPLVDKLISFVPGKSVEVELRLDPLRDPFLVEHRLYGRPQLPAVIGLAAMAQAASFLDSGGQVAELVDFAIVNGLRFFTDEPQTVRVRVELVGGRANCTLVGDFRNRAGRLVVKDRVYMQCTAVLGTAAPISAERWAPPPQWYPMEYREELVIQHGPVLQALKQSFVGPNSAQGWIEASPLSVIGGNRQGNRWLVAIGEVDAALYAAGVLLFVRNSVEAAIPSGAKRLRLGRLPRPGERATTQITWQEISPGELETTMVVLGEDADALCVIEGYRLTKVGLHRAALNSDSGSPKS